MYVQAREFIRRGLAFDRRRGCALGRGSPAAAAGIFLTLAQLVLRRLEFVAQAVYVLVNGAQRIRQVKLGSPLLLWLLPLLALGPFLSLLATPATLLLLVRYGLGFVNRTRLRSRRDRLCRDRTFRGSR